MCTVFTYVVPRVLLTWLSLHFVYSLQLLAPDIHEGMIHRVLRTYKRLSLLCDLRIRSSIITMVYSVIGV